MENWSNFFIAAAGASAALTGLIFVGVSINLTRILAFPTLPPRALISLILLLTIMLLSLVVLIPGQRIELLGCEFLAVGIIVWGRILWMDIRLYKSTLQQYRRQYIFNIIMDQLALLPYVGSGILLLTIGVEGIYLIVPAFIFSFIKAVIDAWVLLVEIQR